MLIISCKRDIWEAVTCYYGIINNKTRLQDFLFIVHGFHLFGVDTNM